MEQCSRLDATGKQLCDNLDPTETCKVIKTLEEKHVVTADALQETMERLEAAKRMQTSYRQTSTRATQ